MSEGLQAGRLEVTVVSVLDGFARELRTKVETAAEGLAAKVKIEVDDKGLRRRLKNAVKEASKGLTAKVKVRVDHDGLRGELDEVARRAADSDIRVPVRPDDEEGGGGGLLDRIRRLFRRAQSEADETPVNVPVQFNMPGRGRGRRGMFRSLALGAIVSLAQPAIAAITQYAAGLTAMVGAAAPAVGVLGALPGLIAATGTAAIATKVAFGGFGEALKQTLKAQSQLADGTKLTKAQQAALDRSLQGLSTSARATVKTVASLSGEWRKMRQSVQERFFSQVKDEIEPLSSAVLPLLRDSLGDAAGQMGNLAKRGAQAMRSGPFAKDFKTVAASNSKVIGNVSDGVANLAAATGHFLVASGPFVERVAEGGERFTRWIRASAQAGRETGSLARFFDHAAEKAKLLGRTTLNLGKGLAGVARAGMDTGNALLTGLEASMLRFNRWANSGEGQKSMKKFFSDAAPTFHELNKLVGDFVRGLGRMSKDNGIRDLIVQIRTELMPAVGRFLDAIGGTIGPAIIGLISNIASLFASLSSAGSGLGVILGSLNGLLNIVNGLLNVVPGAGTAIGVFLGAILAFRVVSGVANLLTGLGTSIRNVGTISTTTAAGAATQTTLWQRMGTAYTTAAAGGGRLSGAMRGVQGAARVMGGAMTGLMGALGGPWGAAIAAITIGIGLLANQHEKAARAAEQQQNRISSLTQALRDSNGAIDANVRAQAVQLLQESKLGDGKTKLVDKLRDVGVGLTDLTNAYLDQGKGLDDLEGKLRKLADAKQQYIEKGRDVWVKGDGPESTKYRQAADALKSLNGELKTSMRDAKEGAAAMNDVGNKGTDSFSRLKTAVEGMSSSTATADDRVNKLKVALDALTGGTQSFHDAQTRVNAAVLSVNDAIANNTDKLKDANAELINQDGSLRTVTRAGQDYNSHLTELRDSSLGAANAAFEMARANDITLPEAMKKAEAEVQKARDAAIQYGMDLGLTKDQAAGLANQMGLIPSSVSVLLQSNGMEKVTADLLSLSTKLLNLPKNETITVDAPTGAAVTALQNLGFQVQMLPGGKQVTISAPTDSARANLGALVGDLAATPGSKTVTVQTLVQQATTDLTNVQNQVAGMKGKTIEVDAPTALARQELENLGFKIRDLKDSKKVEITAPTGTAISQVQSIQGSINSLTGKTVNVTIKYSTVGQPYVSPQADGGIVRFANGGIHRATERIKAFANGAERHIAQIARPGEWRLWAEPETGGEAYIPLAPNKRKRSAAILDEVARMFGGRVVYFANGALRQYAQGAVSMHSSSTRTSAARRATVPSGNTPALVGGDLNLTMTGAPMSPSEALGDALFELRRIRRGGAHVG
ncbi:hypothetical protein EF903_01705 [Streptomyces sp. WAC05292]|uniref:hypothetical protein n=1 Tax=Streptomyces sp. WAC05292 TaxID=2487418 RepID=UPI000F73FD3A|nr:hypothetical protein [Streptomyces sp. WAC05292]RSS97262.1 hypothetical protein EF903_01705 [Streptomyces sp. WAC05292]